MSISEKQIVTPEMIEAGAKAIHAVSAEPEHGDTYEALSLGWKDNLRTHALECYLAMRQLEPDGDEVELAKRLLDAWNRAASNQSDPFREMARAALRSKPPIDRDIERLRREMIAIRVAAMNAEDDALDVIRVASERALYPAIHAIGSQSIEGERG